jgi:hypothetical protein
MAMVFTSEEPYHSVKHIYATWTSDSDGGATATTEFPYDGALLFFVTDPGATAPTDNYDVAITDNNSVDVLAGKGADRDTSTTEYVLASDLGAVSSSKLTFTVTNAGESKVGVIHLYLR